MAGLIKNAATKAKPGGLKKAKDADKDPADPPGAPAVPVQSNERAGDLHPVKVAEGQVLKLPADSVAVNPRNPRKKYTGIPSLSAAIAARGQLQAVKGAERDAYLAIFPEDASIVGNATHVTNLGNRRVRAVQLASDLDEVDFIVDNALAASRLTWLTAATSENVDREQLSVMDLAHAYAEQAAEFGTGGQAHVAKTFGVSEATVSQRIQLTSLIPELQDLIDSAEQKRLFPMSAAVKVAKMGEAEQRKAAATILDLPEADQFQAWKTFTSGAKKKADRPEARPAPAKPPAAKNEPKVESDADPAGDASNESDAPDSTPDRTPTPSPTPNPAGPFATMSVDEVVLELASHFEAPELEKIGTMLLDRVTAPEDSAATA